MEYPIKITLEFVLEIEEQGGEIDYEHNYSSGDLYNIIAEKIEEKLEKNKNKILKLIKESK